MPHLWVRASSCAPPFVPVCLQTLITLLHCPNDRAVSWLSPRPAPPPAHPAGARHTHSCLHRGELHHCAPGLPAGDQQIEHISILWKERKEGREVNYRAGRDVRFIYQTNTKRKHVFSQARGLSWHHFCPASTDPTVSVPPGNNLGRHGAARSAPSKPWCRRAAELRARA